MACTLYTASELVEKIKSLDEALDSAETRSKLDTGQSSHEYNLSITSIKNQREYYIALLQKIDPQCYKDIFGSSVINFRGNSCR